MRLQNLNTAFWFMYFMYVICLLNSIILWQPTTAVLNTGGNETDRFAMLKFKESISNDQDGVLSSWNDSVHYCKWRGVSCSRKHQRITTLDLSYYHLEGSISPYTGNFTFLRILKLQGNRFFGEVPGQVGQLLQMQHLNLSDNMLEGNVPVNLSHCLELKVLDLGMNRLIGVIPMELGSLVKLEVLDLGSNNLTGEFPSFLGNFSSLATFYVGYNNLVGNLPSELGRLKNLATFSIGPNNLSGIIPASLYNISSLRIFDVEYNHFNGTLPPNIGLTLPNLHEFVFGGENGFSGKIPESISNASQLQVIDFTDCNFVRPAPESLGNLPDLSWLGLSGNNLGSYSAHNLDFIASLTNCSQLETLWLEENNFYGLLPDSIANLSTKLTTLGLGYNRLSGNIPLSLQNLVNLRGLFLSMNLFTGDVPESLGTLSNLQFLDFQSNMLSGNIPTSIGNLTRIFKLDLSDNKFKGSIPTSIGDCQNLQFTYLIGNALSGAIPIEVFGLYSSIELYLSSNSLTGEIPDEVGKLKHISALDLSENYLIGEIPKTISDCESIEYLYLQGNFFQGAVPYEIASLKGLQYFDVSRNSLTGKIPKDLEKLHFLMNLNLSFNDLEGEVPEDGIFLNTSVVSVIGNPKLCGGVTELQLPRCLRKGKISSFKLTVIIVCLAVAFLLFLGLVILYQRRKSRRKSSNADFTVSFLPKVSYRRLYEATSGFSTSTLIGTGSFGAVYKGILDERENIVAIKVLNLQQKGAEKSFIAECNALRNIKHRNLVKILTCCSSMDYNGNEFKALVFEFMPNGSLDKWLHHDVILDSENQSRDLNTIQRLNIAIDVAIAIHYLHEECDDPIIHCDLKPSNILLDNELVAHVCDFGLARLISKTFGFVKRDTGTTGIKGTIGYAPPEYAMGCEPSRWGDVYSYGILLLEMFTGKRPTDEMFKDDFNLHNFVKMVLPERLVQIVDSALLPKEVEETTTRNDERSCYNNGGIDQIDVEGRNINFENLNPISPHLQKCLVSVLEIGVACSEESPNERMHMGDVTRELQHIRNAYMSVETNSIRRRTS